MKLFSKEEEVIDGDVTTKVLSGYSENIKSTNIVYFYYANGDYSFKARLNNDKCHINCDGGNGELRDGTRFKLSFDTDTDIFNDLQNVVKEFELTKDNGYYHDVAGLPPGLGDDLEIEYDSGEKIYMHSNQSCNLSEEAIKKIYGIFNVQAKLNGLDFNTDKSNVKIYDDADMDFLQHKWGGTHFGDKFLVEFNGPNIKIYKNGVLTDDTEYSITEGSIRTNKLKDGVIEAKNQYDYEEFSEISSIRKKNNIMLTAYFNKGSYSTCDLLIDKEF